MLCANVLAPGASSLDDPSLAVSLSHDSDSDWWLFGSTPSAEFPDHVDMNPSSPLPATEDGLDLLQVRTPAGNPPVGDAVDSFCFSENKANGNTDLLSVSVAPSPSNTDRPPMAGMPEALHLEEEHTNTIDGVGGAMGAPP